MLKLSRNGAVGFIVWLDGLGATFLDRLAGMPTAKENPYQREDEQNGNEREHGQIASDKESVRWRKAGDMCGASMRLMRKKLKIHRNGIAAENNSCHSDRCESYRSEPKHSI
jgi:hypothetical protein